MLLKGKNILITGTNRGIGKAMLIECAKNGANILAHAREKSDEFLEFIKQLALQYDVAITPIFFDMTDVKLMKEKIREIFKKKIKIDVLINNAGIAHGGFFQMTSVSKIREVFDVDFFSHLELTQLVLKFMTKNKYGSIINIASIAGIDLKEGNCAYGVSKAAIIAWTKVLSRELAKFNIRINAIAPGLTETNMAGLMEPKAGKEMLQNSLMKRLGTPEEIANVAVFLASEKSSFVNGQIIRVDGGSI